LVRQAGRGILLALVTVMFAVVALAADREAVLAPFEKGWPKALDTLVLPEHRNYVVLVQVPPGAPLDARTSDTVRQTLGKRVFRGNRIGHVAMAWQCDGRKGIAGQTGENSKQALIMALTGWGMTPLLSTFTDGHMQMQDAMKAKHARILKKGNGNVLALEVSRQACNRMKDFLVRYVTHPNEPWRKFGLLHDPANFEGGGCVSFSMAMGEHGGIFAGLTPVFTRTTQVYDGILGRKSRAPRSTEPYTGLAAGRDDVVHIPFNRMLRTPHTDRPVIDEIQFIDPELVFAALAGVRSAAGASNEWHAERLLKTDDGTVQRAYLAGRKWAAKYKSFDIIDPEGLSAVVISR
jgi:hypothetical protein